MDYLSNFEVLNKNSFLESNLFYSLHFTLCETEEGTDKKKSLQCVVFKGTAWRKLGAPFLAKLNPFETPMHMMKHFRI